VEPGKLVARGHDAHVTGRHDVEAIADLALLDDDLAVSELQLARGVSDMLDDLGAAALQQRHLLQPGDLLLPAQRHSRPPCTDGGRMVPAGGPESGTVPRFSDSRGSSHPAGR